MCVIVVGPREFVLGFMFIRLIFLELLKMMQSVFPHGKCFFGVDLKQIEVFLNSVEKFDSLQTGDFRRIM